MANEAWQSAWVEVLPDFSNFAKTAKSRFTGILGPAGAAGGIAAGNLAGNLFKGTFLQILGGVLGANIVTGIGYTIGRTIGNAVGAGVAYALSSIDLASDLEQSMGAVKAVFKDQTKFIDDLSLQSAKSLGLSRQDYQSYATLVGAQLKNLGIPFEKVSGQTADLIGLGADLAAQFGGSTSDAVTAISSVLRGERDPIERYGVSIKQTDINARLAAAGLNKLTGDARKQAEIQATLAILYEQTADAQGTFAREGDTLAGQQQRLQASLEDTQTRLGTALLPAFTSLAEYANDHLVPRLDDVVGRLGPKLADALEKATPKVEALLDKVSPLVEDFISWGAEEGLPAVIDGLGDFADAVPGWVDAFKKINDAGDAFMDWYLQSIKDVKNAKDGLNSGIQDFIDGLVEFFGPGPGVVTGKAFADAFLKSATDNDIPGGLSKDLDPKMRGAGESAGQSFADGTKSRLTDAIDVNTLFKSGQDLADGFASGIESRAARVSRAALDAAQGAVISVNKYLKISSPSKVFEQIGGYVSEGMALGIAGNAGMVARAVQSMVPLPDVASSMSSIVGSATVRAGGSDQPIYVQNPFTGEYLLAQVDGRASQVLNVAVNRAVPALAGGK